MLSAWRRNSVGGLVRHPALSLPRSRLHQSGHTYEPSIHVRPPVMRSLGIHRWAGRYGHTIADSHLSRSNPIFDIRPTDTICRSNARNERSE